MPKQTIVLPAIRIRQGNQHIFAFGVDGKRVHEFAAVSRVHRTDQTLAGYQRPEVLSHIRAIRRYLESDAALLPNAIVLAFDSRVEFRALDDDTSEVAYSTVGHLIIPMDPELADDEKPAWLVDGQQRSAAIRDADLEEFPVAAVGFIAKDEAEQRSQFILVNNTKPLPKGLIHELLPTTTAELPAAYARRRLPASVLNTLNFGVDGGEGPFTGRISTPTMANGYIRDNSVLKMIENSLYEGALYQYRNSEDGTGDIPSILMHLNFFWGAVEQVFPSAWRLPPTKSRLTHGAGIQSLGYVMDTLTEGVPAAELPGLGIEEVLIELREHCAWTEGTWDFGPDQVRRWNGIQNTPNDVRLLTSHLLRHVRASGVLAIRR
ncbi:DGQHR domain-containing protein DpdB [Orlajensenia leifsoniae]|uniref:DGQHR domain-containing protein n=1 Tax=Orlajensenia leifsoniae TaxID=2561933 RepID=A0A4Y9QW92_9MICO|nr:DGQHR domain-containing protein DpdB [Leifsonia flava]TFV95403.1 DGQHR domain-containing protein [Leifsonia flava]